MINYLRAIFDLQTSCFLSVSSAASSEYCFKMMGHLNRDMETVLQAVSLTHTHAHTSLSSVSLLRSLQQWEAVCV